MGHFLDGDGFDDRPVSQRNLALPESQKARRYERRHHGPLSHHIRQLCLLVEVSRGFCRKSVMFEKLAQVVTIKNFVLRKLMTEPSPKSRYTSKSLQFLDKTLFGPYFSRIKMASLNCSN